MYTPLKILFHAPQGIMDLVSYKDSSTIWFTPFPRLQKFIEFCHRSSVEERARMVEFYMHNIILTYNNFWEPNCRMGDV